MERVFTAIALGILALGGRHAYRHLKQNRKRSLQQAKLEVWEEEGGSVPVAPDRIAAQVSPATASPAADS